MCLTDAAPPTPLYFFDCDPTELADAFVAWGLKAFRAKQVVQWVYERGVSDFDAMTNLSRADRAVLRERLLIESGEAIRHQLATDGTQKLLIAWDELDTPSTPPSEAPRVFGPASTALPLMGGSGVGVSDPRPQTECVMIPSDSRASGRKRQTACISSQVGCPVGCHFCASGLGGLEQNLAAGRIVEQVWRLGRLEGVGRITNVVFMGMGEPLANFAAVSKALRHLTADWGLGLPPAGSPSAPWACPAASAASRSSTFPSPWPSQLHAPNDEVRRRIIPWAEFVSVDQLIDAGRHYFDKTGREITLEYILLRGVNDRPEHARELARVAKKPAEQRQPDPLQRGQGSGVQPPGTEDVHRSRKF